MAISRGHWGKEKPRRAKRGLPNTKQTCQTARDKRPKRSKTGPRHPKKSLVALRTFLDSMPGLVAVRAF